MVLKGEEGQGRLLFWREGHTMWWDAQVSRRHCDTLRSTGPMPASYFSPPLHPEPGRASLLSALSC